VEITWFPDLDGDGWANADGEAVVSCEAPPDMAERRGDCDDSNGMVAPDALEICDGIDNDCSGEEGENIVTLFETEGGITDVTAVISTGEYLMRTDGELVFCPGDYVVDLDIEADGVVRGGAEPGDTIISGEIDLVYGSRNIEIAGLTLTGRGFVTDGSPDLVTFTDVIFTGIDADWHAAVDIHNTDKIVIDGCTFESNTSGSMGAPAVEIIGGEVEIIDSVFRLNSGTSASVADFWQSVVTIENSIFEDNAATWGTTLSIDAEEDFILTDSMFINNSGDGAGAIENLRADLYCTRSTFHRNRGEEAGAIAFGAGTVSANDCHFGVDEEDNPPGDICGQFGCVSFEDNATFVCTEAGC
jgi:hypothetical protein